MFTGIIEGLGTLVEVRPEGTNLHFVIEAHFDEPLKIDQSVAHNGVCLTVVGVSQGDMLQTYQVTAVEETLAKTNLGGIPIGAKINLERCLKVGQRLDGHFVQGHVDCVGKVLTIEKREGSWFLTLGFDSKWAPYLVGRGSICVNGVSLTVVEAGEESFSLTLIPFTWEHTNLQFLQEGESVNLEFDILGKYFLRSQALQKDN